MNVKSGTIEAEIKNKLDELSEIMSEMYYAHVHFEESCKKLQEQKSLYPEELYVKELDRLFQTYEYNYSTLVLRTREKIHHVAAHICSNEQQIEECRVTVEQLNKQYQVKLPPKNPTIENKYYLYDPKRKCPKYEL